MRIDSRLGLQGQDMTGVLWNEKRFYLVTLFRDFVRRMTSIQGIKRFKVVVGIVNKRTCRFYEKLQVGWMNL